MLAPPSATTETFGWPVVHRRVYKNRVILWRGVNVAMLAGFKYWKFSKVETGQVIGWF